jgi:hypothetical protein
MPLVVFAGVYIDLPPGWFDISDTLPSGSPFTLARSEQSDNGGALQFSVRKYKSGERPGFTSADLVALLTDFARDRDLGEPQDQTQETSAFTTVVYADFRDEAVFHRAWYVTNGMDIAFVTYTRLAEHEGNGEELAQANGIVRSLRFRAEEPR